MIALFKTRCGLNLLSEMKSGVAAISLVITMVC